MIVLDASAAIAALLNAGPEAADIQRRISHPDETLHVPHLFEVEVLHALRRLNLAGTVSSERAHLALDRFQDTSFTRYPHSPLLERIWELRNTLSAYDAAYVALAEALDAPLITLDAKLSQAPGIRAVVELYE